MRKFIGFAFVSAALLCGCPQQSGTTTPATGGDKPADTKPADGTKPADTKPADTKPADTKPAAAENFWHDVGEGTTAEYKSTTEVAGNKMETAMKYILKSKTDKGYVLTMENTVMGNTTKMDMPETPWAVASDAKPTETKSSAKDMGEEDVKVGDQTLKCKHWQTEASGNTTDSWMYKTTLIVKSVTKGAANTTMELTKLDKK